jgi:hypothetical protein
MTIVHGAMKPKKEGTRKVKHFRVTKAKNGFVAHHELEPKKATGRDGMLGRYEPDPEPNVFNDKAALMAHLGGLADRMGDPDEASEPGEAPEPA